MKNTQKKTIEKLVDDAIWSLDSIGRDFNREVSVSVQTRTSSNNRFSRNGGDYSQWTIYRPLTKNIQLEKSLFEVSYETSSDFSFDPRTGRYTQWDSEDGCEYTTVTAAELQLILENAKNNEQGISCSKWTRVVTSI